MGSRFRQAGGLSPLLGDRGKGILEFKRARLNGSGIVEDLVDETAASLSAAEVWGIASLRKPIAEALANPVREG